MMGSALFIPPFDPDLTPSPLARTRFITAAMPERSIR